MVKPPNQPLTPASGIGIELSMKTMTVWGVGPTWGLLTVIYGGLCSRLGHMFPTLLIPDSFYPRLKYVGLLLLAVGIPFCVLSARAIVRGFAAGRLVTDGVYGVCRHPLYASWIIFLIPGFTLLLHSWIGLSTSLASYALLRVMAKKEEDYLDQTFGEAYRHYRRRTPFVLPLGWLKRQAL
jgi:protein-S-isoprenylcysteine O-methyltransferase Ste14